MLYDAPEPISEVLADTVVSALRGIIEGADAGNGAKYSCTLRDPHRVTMELAEGSPHNLSTLVWQQDQEPDDDGGVPYGQTEYWQTFTVSTIVRQSRDDKTPVKRTANFVRADIERALLSNIRKSTEEYPGGICYVDNVLLLSKSVEDNAAKLYDVRVSILCQYRTLRGQPDVLAPTAGNEYFQQTAATLYVAPIVSPGVYGAWQTYADVRVIPRIEALLETKSDDWQTGGPQVPYLQVYAGHVLRYEVDAGYINADLIARQFGGVVGAPDVQQAGQRSGVPIMVTSSGGLLPLVDADGSDVYGVTAVGVVMSADAATTYAAGVDYVADPATLAAGFLRLPPASRITLGTRLLVSYAAPAITRPTVAAGSACGATCRARIVWTAADGAQMVHGTFVGSLVASAVVVKPGEPTATRLTLTVLEDGTGASPLGTIRLPAGKGFDLLF